MNVGTEFEHDLSEELGLGLVPGSGNQWYSKLDLNGRGTRWSLKATSKVSGISINPATLEEAIAATDGIGGTDEIPIWATRIPSGDFITMRKEDWVATVKERGFSVPQSKSEERRSRARVPQLLRGDDGN